MKIVSILWVVALIFLAGLSVRAENLPKNSVYNLKSKWKNVDGKEISLKDLQGENVLVSMVYTKCPHACPMIISKISKIEKELSKKTKKNFKVVLASFDHKRDTPENLKAYGKSRKLDESKWIFLSPSDEATARELAVVLGISFKELDDGEFSHSNVIGLLDKNGVMKSKVENLNADITPLVEAFKE